jgi:hypothetical protein
MKKFEEIVQYHLDNNLKEISAKHSRGLSGSEKKELKSILHLNSRLNSIKVKDAFGIRAFEAVLSDIKEPVKNPVLSGFNSLRLAGSVFAIVAVFAVAGGLGFISYNKSNQNNNLNVSKVAANGSVENLNNLNIADAQNDISLASETKMDQTVNTEFSAQPLVDEVINENF